MRPPQGMDETNAKFNHMMDTLNVFMEEKTLPHELRVRYPIPLP